MKRIATLMLLLFGLIAVANPKQPPTAKQKKLYHLKKAKYHEIQAKLQAGDITIEEAQRLWRKEINKLKKREGK